MATLKQIRANRRNAQKNTGPQTPEAKERVRFNALSHGLRAESAVLPGEDQAKYDQHLERLSNSWMPQDEQEKDLVETIASNQWKLARLDRSEAMFYVPGAMTPQEFALATHRIHLTQGRLERAISHTIADLQRYRKEREARLEALGFGKNDIFRQGLIWGNSQGNRYFEVLPAVMGLDGKWRDIPRELLACPGPVRYPPEQRPTIISGDPLPPS